MDVPFHLLPLLAGDAADTEVLPADDGTSLGLRTVAQVRGMSRAQLGALQAASGSQRAYRMALLKPVWRAIRAAQMAMNPPVPAVGTIYYCDPQKATNGVGTFADPFNTFPSSETMSGNTLRFKERSVLGIRLVMGSVTGSMVFQTYDAVTGQPVYDQSRLATITPVGEGGFGPAGRRQCANLITNGAVDATIALSGLRMTGSFSDIGGASGPFIGNGGGGFVGNKAIVEHCVIEGLIATACGTLVDIRCEHNIVRFCRITGPHDGIWSASRTGTNYRFEAYGNEIVIPASTAWNGPDGIQLTREAGSACGVVNIAYNWLDHRANCKQGIIVANNPPAPTGLEMVTIHGNFMWGIEVEGAPGLGDSSMFAHTAWIHDGVGTRVTSNYVDGWRFWGSIGSAQGDANSMHRTRGLMMNNIFRSSAQIWSTGSPMAGAAGDYAIVANNTFINGGAPWPSNAGSLHVAGGNNVLRNNLFLGPWKFGVKFTGPVHAEDHNLFYGLTSFPLATSGNGSAATHASDIIGLNPLLDALGRPALGSPVIGAGAPVLGWSGELLRFPDPFGNTSDDDSRPWVGAVQQFSAF